MNKGITTERKGYLLQELFKLLLKYPDGIQAKDALEILSKNLKLTEHESGEYKKGGQRFDKVVRFATVTAVKAGWMRKDRGIWFITEEGSSALEKNNDPSIFYKKAFLLYRQWQKSRIVDEEIEEEEEEEATGNAGITFEEAEEQALEEIKTYFENINPYDLQDIVAALLEAMGYYVSWVSPQGKDGGIDILAWNDPQGTKPPRIKVQVKRRKDSIAVEELRSFLALINEDDVGIFVSTGAFTKDAQDIARTQERRKITLIDRQKLIDLWIEYNDKIEKDKRNLLPLKPIYFIAPE